MAILPSREGLSLEATIVSDTASRGGVVHRLIATVGSSVRAMRDPTCGGVAGACEILGRDPHLVANEGKMLPAAAPEMAETALKAIKADPLDSNAAVIGCADPSHPGRLSV